MDIGLRYRVEPEIDSRKAEKESEKFASSLDDKIKDLDPTGFTDSLFDTDDMFEDLEQMQNMAEDTAASFGMDSLDSSGFAGDLLFESGPAEMQSQDSTGIKSLFDDVADTLMDRDTNRGRMGSGLKHKDILEGIGETLEQNNHLTAKAAAASSGLARALKVGAAAITVVGLGLVFLKGIWNSVKGLADASPLLQQVVNLISMTSRLFLRPIANVLGQLLLPIAISLLELAAGFNQAFGTGENITESLWNGFSFLASELIQALFSLEGIFVAALTTAGAIIGRHIGIKAGAFLGAKLGAIVGSFFGPGGTVVGAVLGAALGGTLGLIVSTIIAFNTDFSGAMSTVIDWLEALVGWVFDIFRRIDGIASIVSGLFLGFLLLGIQFFFGVLDLLGRLLDSFGLVRDFLSGEITFSELVEGVGDIFEGSLIDDLYTWIIDRFPGWESAMEFGSDIFDWVVERFPGWDSVDSVASNIYDRIVDRFPGWDDVDNLASDIFNRAMRGFPGWGTLIGVGADIVDDVVSRFRGWGTYIETVRFNISPFPGWGRFIPSVSFNIPSFPGWSEIIGGVSNTVGNVSESITGGSTFSSQAQQVNSNAQSYFGFASGGIVQDSVLGMIGEGTESEVVAPLSQIGKFVEMGGDTNVSTTISDSAGSDNLENAISQGFDEMDDNVDDDEIIRQLKLMVRAIKQLQGEFDVSIDLEDESKWEIRK